MIVLETVSYIFLGVAMIRLEPAMKIEIIISFSRCLIRANVHIFHENRDWKLNPHWLYNILRVFWFCFFVWFDSLRPINNLSVIKGRVFLGWTSTKLWLMFLLKDTTQWRRWGSNPRPFGLESSTLPLSHYAPYVCVLKINPNWSRYYDTRFNPS